MFAELVNAIRTSILGERVCYFSISKLGINAPSRWRMDVTPLAEETLGLLLAPWIGSSIDSKSAYIINGTLNSY